MRYEQQSMFPRQSSYSPFFISGFSQYPDVSRSVSLADTKTSPIYLDAEFSDNEQYRSFLSLDLAETPSTHSVSFKCKVTSSKHTTIKSRPKIKYVPRYSELILPLTQCAAVLSERFPAAALCDPVPRLDLFPQRLFLPLRLVNSSN